MIKRVKLTEENLHRIVESAVRGVLMEVAKKPTTYMDLSILDELDYIKPGDVKTIIRAIVGDINAKKCPFAPIHKLVKFFDPKRNHVGGKNLIYSVLKSKMPEFDGLLAKLNKHYYETINLAKANYGGFQKLDEFNIHLMEIYTIVEAMADVIKRSGMTDPGSNITAINGGNGGKDIGITRIVGDARVCLINLSNLSMKIERLIKNGKDPFSYNPYR